MAEKSDYISRSDIVKIAKKTDPDELITENPGII
jgi:hypothetical protein